MKPKPNLVQCENLRRHGDELINTDVKTTVTK